MANRYWVGGNAAWDATAGTKWATTSGGAGGSAIPTAADDVFFDNGAGTGNVTSVTAAAVARSINFTGYVGTFTHSAGITIAIGDGTAGASNIALKLVAGMTYTLGSATTSAFSFVSTSATQQTIAFGTKANGNVRFTGVGSSYLLNDTVAQGATATWTHTSGIIDFNSLNHVFGFYSSAGALARTITFGSAQITCAGAAGAGAWNLGTVTNLTFNKGTGKITLTGGGSILGAGLFNGGGLTYNDVVITYPAGGGLYTVSQANTFATFSITASAAKYNEVRFANNQTVSGTFTINGSTVDNRLLLRSSVINTKRTLTVATLSSNSFVDFMDITAAGTSSPWSDTGWGILRVTSITGATPVTTYWVGGTGNQSDATKYSSSSGGTANTQRAPLPQDIARYDANSGAGALTIDLTAFGTVDFSNTALTSFIHNGGFTSRYYCGDLTLVSSCPGSFGGFPDSIAFVGSGTITTTGTTFTTHTISMNTPGTLTLGSDFSTNSLTFAGGTFSANNFNVSANSVAKTAGTLNMGGGTWTLVSQSAGTVWWHTSGTLNAGTSIIYWSNTSANNQTFAGGTSITYNDISIAAGGAGICTFTGSNTFDSITMASAGTKTVKFTSGTTTTLLSNSFLRGTSGNKITISSQTNAAIFTLAYSGTITTDYINLRDSTASGGTPFYAGANSTDNTGNTNWSFTAAPSSSALLMLGIG